MTNIVLEFPLGFEDRASEAEDKGWVSGVVAVIEGRRYTLSLYAPGRLAQDIEYEVKTAKFFLEPNLVVVAAITPENIASAVQEIVRTGRVGDLQLDQE